MFPISPSAIWTSTGYLRFVVVPDRFVWLNLTFVVHPFTGSSSVDAENMVWSSLVSTRPPSIKATIIGLLMVPSRLYFGIVGHNMLKCIQYPLRSSQTPPLGRSVSVRAALALKSNFTQSFACVDTLARKLYL